MAKLTWNQHRALFRLAMHGHRGAGAGTIGDLTRSLDHPHLCVASARSACMALVRKGLVEVASAGCPMIYRITNAGREALSEHYKTEAE